MVQVLLRLQFASGGNRLFRIGLRKGLRNTSGWVSGKPLLRARLRHNGAPVWGTSRLAMIGGNLWLCLIISFMLAVTRDTWTIGWFAGFVAVGGAGSWVFILRPWVGIDGDDLVVINPLGGRRISLTDVAWVEPGSTGLEIVMIDATSVTAWAIQQGNLTTALGRPSRSKEIASEIQQKVTEAKVRSRTSSEPPGDVKVRDANRRSESGSDG